jgi:hypothetical protein
VTGRTRDASAFRADPALTPSSRPSRRQTVALVAVLLLVCGAVALASYLVRPDRARAFQLFHGSLFLTDEQSPVAVDLTTGRPTLRLVGADKQVGSVAGDGLGVVPLDGATLLLNQRTGEFNMVDTGGFLVKHDGGVPLGRASGRTSALGVASGQLAYVVRNSSAGSDVYLVGEATVSAAAGGTTAVTPRASTTLPATTISTADGGAVAANGALWVLAADRTGQRHVQELTYPADSNAGARLTPHDRGGVSGPAALGTAASGTGTSIAVATGDRIRLLDGTKRTATFPSPSGFDAVLPTTSSDRRLAFLLHGSGGWRVVSVAVDGTGLRPPTAVAGVPPSAPLAPPAYSAGALFTVDRSTGVVYRIGLDGAARPIATYPLAQLHGVDAEPASMPDAYVIARETRVVVNSGTHDYALMLYGDGSAPPQRIAKSTAVQVSASGGAEQLTRSSVAPGQPPDRVPPSGGPKPRPVPGQVVNPHVDCADATQKPHIPIVGAVQAGSRSVTLNWTYPIIDRTQDCFPTTYTVEVDLLSANAPPPPGLVRVQSQVGATITGLFPESRYRLRVTAYIHDQGTSSDWFEVRTGPEGPAAPSDLTVAADNAGNWQLKWNSCGGVDTGCVPVQSWTVTPSFCDGRGVSQPPAAVTAPADPTARSQPAFTYPGSDALLGRGLEFVVTGTGSSQVPGTPSARTPCVVSWRPPDAGALTLSASHPANSALGGTTSTTVRLDIAGNTDRAMGGVGAKVRFEITGGGIDRSTTLTYDGSATSVTSTFPGLRAGVTYQASVTVAPPGHPEAAVSVGPQPVTVAADWPAVGLNADCVPQGTIVQTTCAFSAHITGISSAAVGGETFDLVDTADTQSAVTCGSRGKSLVRSGIDPADPITDTLSLLSGFSGTCTVTLVLRENGSIFGGTLKTVSAQYTVGPATTYDPTANDFAVAWDPPASQVLVTYRGHGLTLDELAQITQNWTVTVRGPGGQSCGTRNFDSPPDGVDAPASASCVAQYGQQSGWSVDIDYEDAGTGDAHSVPGDHSLDGTPPGYQACAPTKFDASWSGTLAAPTITLSVQGTLAGCDNWKYALVDPLGAACPASTSGTPDDVVITPACATPPSKDDWTLHVTWTDPAGNPQSTDATVAGNPPKQ